MELDRKQALSACTEEELLLEQQKFLSQSKAPSASVTRITRVKPAAATPSPTSAPPAPEITKPAPSSHEKGSSSTSLPGVVEMRASDVLGDIQERIVEHQPQSLAPSARNSAATALGGEPGSFPAATHRKESKFALSRRAKAAAGSTNPQAATSTTQAVSSGAGSGPVAAPAAVQGASSDDIHEKNMAQISSMSQTEVARAVEELASRLDAKTLAFLKARGAKKLMQGGTAAGQGSSSASQPVVGSASVSRVEAEGGSWEKLTRRAAAATNLTASSPAATARPSPPAASAGPDPVTAGGTAAATAGVSGGVKAADQADGDALPADPRLFARVRWGFDAEVLGVQPRDEVLTVSQVLNRDQLRKDEGVVPEGHTISELLLLARSAVPAQRIAALNMLAALLALARPTPADTGTLGCPPTPRTLALPRHLCSTDASGVPQQQAVRWLDVWQYLVSELVIASHLRLALDDSQMPIISAGMMGMAVLISPGAEEAAALEALVSCPRLGWPAPATAPLSRVQAGATWAVHPVVQPPVSDTPDEEDSTPEDVAGLDPVAGLLQMQLLSRLMYVLNTMAPTPETTSHALACLCACASHSKAAAMQIAKYPKLLEWLKGLLLHNPPSDDPPSRSSTASAGTIQQPAAGSDTSGGVTSSSSAHLSIQVSVLRLLRIMCTASPVAAQLIRSAGVLPAIQGHLLVSCNALTAHSSLRHQPDLLVQHTLLVAEVLRMWRVYAAPGIHWMGFESVHASLAPLMMPPEVLPTDASLPAHSHVAAVHPHGNGSGEHAEEADQTQGTGGSSSLHSQLLVVMRWHVAREVYVLLDALQAHALAVAAGDQSLGAPMLQPGTAAALADEAVQVWLASPCCLTLMGRMLAELRSSCQPLLHGSPAEWSKWLASGVHPLLLLPPAACYLSTWAAVLQSLATYWSSIPVSTPVFGQITAALTTSGLLHPFTDPQHEQPKLTVSTSEPPNRSLKASDQLAVLLLSTSQARDLGHLGRLITCTVVEHLTTSSTAPDASLQVAGSEFLAGLLRLAAALFPPRQPVQQAEGAPAKSSVAISPQQLQAGLLIPLSKVLVQAVARGHSSASSVLQPWQTASLAAWQPQVRLLLRVCDVCGAQVASAAGQQQAVQPHSEASLVSDALLCVPSCSLPGGEMQCLKALKHLTDPTRLKPILTAGLAAIHQLHAQHPVLHLSAGGVRFQHMQTALDAQGGSVQLSAAPSSSPNPVGDAASLSTSGDVPSTGGSRPDAGMPYPSPQADDVDTRAVSRVLFRGYTAAWLSMLPADDYDHSPDGQPTSAPANDSLNQQQAAPAARPPTKFPGPGLDDVQGSRLPVPPTWLLSEVLQVPAVASRRQQHTRPKATQLATTQGKEVHPVGAALMLVCGLNALGSEYVLSCCGGAGPRFQHALHLAYTYNSAELVQQQQHQGRAASKGVDGDAGATLDSSLGTMQWLEPLVRWPLAVLTHSWALEGGAATGFWCGVQLAERLSQQFGNASFGDPLYAQHMMTLLHPATAAPVQQAAWMALGQDQALPLLPPPHLCMYPPAQLLQQTTRDPGVLGALVRILTTKDLNKALASGSVAADLAVASIARFLCNPEQPVSEPVAEGLSCQASLSALLGGQKPSAEETQEKAVLRAVGMARSVVQALTMQEVQEFVSKAQSVGCSKQQVGSALVQACRGNLQLMDKLKQALADSRA